MPKRTTRTEQAYRRLTGEHPIVPSGPVKALDDLTAHWAECAECHASADGFCSVGRKLYEAGLQTGGGGND